MNKKILAVALAILFIATAFTACKTKLDMTEINGTEYPLLTDKNGETIINEENQVAVIVTDREGEVITYENGEEQTRWLQLEGDYVTDSQVQGKLYKLNVLKGWTGNKYGRVEKNKTDGKCYIKFATHKKLESEETLETYMHTVDATNEMIGDVINDPVQFEASVEKNPSLAVYKDCKYESSKSDAMVGGKYNGQCRTYKITDKNGNIVHYAENYYFEYNGVVYSVDYACENGEGYDSSFSFASYVSSNFQFKEPKK